MTFNIMLHIVSRCTLMLFFFFFISFFKLFFETIILSVFLFRLKELCQDCFHSNEDKELGENGQQHLSTTVAHTVFCSLSLFYFSISNMRCREENAQSLVKSLQLHGRVCTFVNNLLAVLCTCSIGGKVVLQ